MDKYPRKDHESVLERYLQQAAKRLGLPVRFTADDVKLAFKQKAKTAHPDVPGGDTAAFQALGKAKKLLLADIAAEARRASRA
jgi:hypothetical protein